MNVIQAIEQSEHHTAQQYIAKERVDHGRGYGYTVFIERKNNETYVVECWVNGENEPIGHCEFRDGNDFQRAAAAQQYAMECSLVIEPQRWMPA